MSQVKNRDYPESLGTADVHEVLRNNRRYLVLKLLSQESNGELTVRELSERIANEETNEAPAPRDARQSVYVSLHQTHLPKLDDLDVIEYNTQSKTVRMHDRASEILQYTVPHPTGGIPWNPILLGLAAAGILLVLGAEFGLPFLADVGPVTWAVLVFTSIGAAAAFQLAKDY